MSTEELMHATGVHWWEFVMPDGAENRTLGLYFAPRGDGAPSFGGTSGWTSGERVKVFVFDIDKEMLGYSVVGKNAQSMARIPNRFYHLASVLSSSRSGATVEVGDVLLKKSESERVSLKNELREGEVGLVIGLYETEPNKAVEPTPVAVTSCADAHLAPATSVAHL